MTRINTNVVSLNAQKILARSNAQLEEALTRLSTGLRINTGKDDPAGLIASEVLRSDMVSTEAAIQNSETANQVIATADSALGQVSSLLNDIRGLVSEAANTGAMSADQIAANQLQIDSSLEAIDRIAQVTQFQGKRLLDGSLDFITEGVDSSKLTSLQVDQANFGTQTEISVTVQVASAAKQAQLSYSLGAISENTVLEIGGKSGFEAFSFAADSTVEEMAAAINLVSDSLGVRAEVQTGSTKGAITVSSAGQNNDIQLTANQAGFDAGDIDIKYVKGGTTATSVRYTAKAGDESAQIVVELQTEAWEAAKVTQMDDSDLEANGDEAVYQVIFNKDGGGATGLTLTAASAGAEYNVREFKMVDGTAAGVTAGNEIVQWDEGSGTLTVIMQDGVSTMDNIKGKITGEGTFTAANVGASSAVIIGRGAELTAQTVSTGAVANNALDITAKLSGAQFNNTAVHIVSGNASGTEAGITTTRTMATNQYYGEKATGQTINDFSITAKEGGKYGGAQGEDLTIEFVDAAPSGGGVDVDMDLDNNKLTITADLSATTAKQISDAIDADTTAKMHVDASYSGTGEHNVGSLDAEQTTRTLGDGGTPTQGSLVLSDGTDSITIAATAGGPLDGAKINGLTVTFAETELAAAVALNVTNMTLTISGDWDGSGAGTPTNDDIATALATATITGGEAGLTAADYVSITSNGTNAAIGGAAAGSKLFTEADTLFGASSAVTAAVGDGQAVAGRGETPVTISYSQDATKAVASVSGLGAGTSFTLIAPEAGSAYNGVQVKFVDNNVAAPTASYDADEKILTITGDSTNTAIGDVLTAIERDTDFQAVADSSVTTYNAAAKITFTDGTVHGNTGSSGGDAGTLFVYVEEGVTTAADVVSALGQNWNEQAAALFSISSSQDNDGSGLLFDQAHDNALTGGVTGGSVVATGQDVVNALQADAQVSALISAGLVSGNTGTTAVSEFNQSATYGSVTAATALQFLGPEGSRNVRFVSTPGTGLSVDFSTTPDKTAQARATLAALNANASLTFSAMEQGEEYDDMVVRFKAAAEGVTENTVTYDRQESASQAYLTFGTADKNLILTASENGDRFNDVQVNFTVDSTITGDASASYDASSKVLTVKVKNDATDANDIMAAINTEGTFRAELDYTDERDNAGTGAGFATLVGTNGTDGTWTVGNTGSTGGHKGGTLEFVLAEGKDTAADVIATLNNDNLAKKSFTASAYSAGNDSGQISYRDDTNKAISSGGVEEEGVMTVHLATNSSGIVTTTAAELVSYFDTLSSEQTRGVSVSLLGSGNDGSGRLAATSSDLDFTSAGTTMVDAYASGDVTAVNGVNARFTLTAKTKGTAYDGVTLRYVNDGTKGSETAEYNSTSKVLTVHVDATAGTGTTAEDVQTAIEADLGDLFTVEQIGDGSGVVSLLDSATLSGGRVNSGSENGASFTGNEDGAAMGMDIVSTDYGSAAFVSVKTLQGSFSMTNSDGAVADRVNGVDLDARVNGVQAVGKGLSGTINTSALDLTFSLDASVSAGQSVSFKITGGGAQFQLGPDVVSNQQARLGIQSVSTAKLGGSSGRLFELRSGGAKDLVTDIKGAAAIVEDVITQVTTLRGRLGAFQRTTLSTNIAALNDTLEALTEAESSIRDADFASESAKLTRAQILVQSGTSVLSIANQNPQNVLSLLR